MKILILVFFINICTLALSEDSINCLPLPGINNLGLKIFSNFVIQNEHIKDYPNVDVYEASCKINLSSTEIEKRIEVRAQKDSWRKKDKELHGIKFENEYSSLLALFDKLTTKEGDITRKYIFESQCKKVLCAVKEIFGENLGPKILYILQEYGLNGSFYSFNNADNWEHNELDILLQGLEDLPRGLLPLNDNKSFVRHKRGSMCKKGVTANSELRFFDCWQYSYRGIEKMFTLTHEIGHYIRSELGLEDSPEWLKLSGWETELYYNQNRELRSRWSNNKDACFLSTYGQKNPNEDFAEMFVAYRYTPELLKRACPEKYRFMKDLIFNKIEFTKDKKFCEKQPKLKYENGLWRFFRRKTTF